MRFRQRRGKLMLRQVLEIDAVKQQNIAELDAINRTQTIKFKNARDRIRIFDLRQPGVRDVKLSVVFG